MWTNSIYGVTTHEASSPTPPENSKAKNGLCNKFNLLVFWTRGLSPERWPTSVAEVTQLLETMWNSAEGEDLSFYVRESRTRWRGSGYKGHLADPGWWQSSGFLPTPGAVTGLCHLGVGLILNRGLNIR